MKKLRYLLSIFIYSTLFVGCAFPQTGLTQILDIVYNADDTPFTGTLIITWNGFTAPSGSTIAPHSTSTQILNGALSVFLVPSTTASAGAYYLATYNSSDGTVTWSETWQIPPSTTPLTLNDVRQASAGGGGSPGGGGGTQYATLPIAIDEITGLSADLAAADASVTALTAIVSGNSGTIAGLTISVNTLNTKVTSLTNSLASLTAIVNTLTAGSNAVFVDEEIPSGTIDGTNAVFALVNTPAPTASLSLYRNGLVQTNGIDYTLAGNAITFSGNNIPQPSDILQAYYRIAGTGPVPTFADSEVPAGTIDGTNLTYVLAAAPSPALSLKLYKNGVLMRQDSDYTVSDATILFAGTSVTPQAGDSLIASYRH